MAYRPTVTIRILVNGTWTNISSYVLQGEPWTVNRGAGGEDNSMPPTSATLTLRNPDGRFTVENPTGPYWPYLQQNIQCHGYITDGGVDYYRFWGEISEWPVNATNPPKNSTVQVEITGIFGRWERDLPVISPLRRTILKATNLIAYWPMEDEGSNTQELEAASPATNPMNIKLAVDFASYSGVVGSKPVVGMGTGAVDWKVPAYNAVGNQNVFFITNGAVSADDTAIAYIHCGGGTLSSVAILAHTNGDLRIRSFDQDGVIATTTSYTGAHNINDRDVMVRVILANSGSDVNWFVGVSSSLDADSSTDTSTTGTFTTRSFTRLRAGSYGSIGIPIGQTAVFNGNPTNVTAIFEALRGYRGETTGTRYLRICAENGVAARIVGDPGSTPRMGPQPIDTVREIIRDCANVGQALVFESRDEFGITMVTLDATCNQRTNQELSGRAELAATGTTTTAVLDSTQIPAYWEGSQFKIRNDSGDTLFDNDVFTITDVTSQGGGDYQITWTPAAASAPGSGQYLVAYRSAVAALDFAELQGPLKPSRDSRLAWNSVTVSRRSGSGYTLEESEGPRGLLDPPDGMGFLPNPQTLNIHSDGELRQHAGWILHIGQNGESRWPAMEVELAHPSLTAKRPTLLNLDVGWLVTVDGTSDIYMFDQVRQIARGYTETFNGNRLQNISVNGVPERPYRVLKFNSNPLMVGQGTSLTSGYLIALETPAREVNDGDRAWLRNSTGAVKQATLFTVTRGVTSGGFTNLNISPNANAVTVAGDYLEIVREDSRLGSKGTTMAQALTTTQTGAVSVSPSSPWTTDPADFPQNIMIDGEEVTISAISGGAGSASFGNTGTASTGDNASVTPGLPTGVVSGDTVLILASIRNDAATVNTPASWTLVHSAGSNFKLFSRVYNGVWTMPTVTFSGGSVGNTTIGQSCAVTGIGTSATVTNTPLSGTGQDVRVSTNNMASVSGQFGLRLAVAVKFDDWTSTDVPAGLTEIQETTTTTGSDASQVWAYALDSSSGNFPGSSGLFDVTGGASAFYESFVVFFGAAPVTFTIAAGGRSVNGVVKTHAIGAPVDVAAPSYYGLGA